MSKLDELIKEFCPNGGIIINCHSYLKPKMDILYRKNSSKYWANGTIPWFRMEDIRENGRILCEAIQNVFESAVKGKMFLRDLIIVSTSATIGEHALTTVLSLANQRFTYLMMRNEYH